MKLKLGKMTSKEMAIWFNLSYNTYKNKIAYYLEKLEDYCEFERIYGGIIVKEIYIEEYDKNLSINDQKLVLEEIRSCIETQGGLSTISGMSRKCVKNQIFPSISTAKKRISKASLNLFGETKTLTSHGTAGSREYLWAIKLDDYNHYRYMTKEEEKRFDDIICTCYAIKPEQVKQAALLENQLKEKEIDVDEYFELKNRLGLNTFKDCIFKFKEETGYMIVKCTKHEIENSMPWEDENQEEK